MVITTMSGGTATGATTTITTTLPWSVSWRSRTWIRWPRNSPSGSFGSWPRRRPIPTGCRWRRWPSTRWERWTRWWTWPWPESAWRRWPRIGCLASPVKLGRGTIQIQHGTYPVPPPASARLAVGMPVAPVPDAITRPNVELSTPTGLAILKALDPRVRGGVALGDPPGPGLRGRHHGSGRLPERVQGGVGGGGPRNPGAGGADADARPQPSRPSLRNRSGRGNPLQRG